MKNRFGNVGVALARLWCVTSLATVFVVAGLSRAEEPACPCPSAAAHPTATPVLSKLPYLNRLFITLGLDGQGRVVRQVSGSGDWLPQICPAGQALFTAKDVRVECEVNGDCRTCTITKTATATGSECACGTDCAATNCANCKCQSCACESKADEASCGQDCGVLVVKREIKQLPEGLPCPFMLMEKIASLMAEKAAAEAALQARQEADERIEGLIETVAELLADNAALDAKLESQTEHAKLHEKLADLAAENARLKAHVELAAERADLHRGSLMLSLENERLKQRLVEIEDKQASEAVRTSARPRGERKAR
jgi:hypothetical protein